MVKRSNSLSPPPPVAWIGKRTGQRIRQPPRHMFLNTLRNRRKKKASSEPLLRTTVSGTLKKGTTQPNQVDGRALVGSLLQSATIATREGAKATYSGARKAAIVRGAYTRVHLRRRTVKTMMHIATYMDIGMKVAPSLPSDDVLLLADVLSVPPPSESPLPAPTRGSLPPFCEQVG